MGPVLYRASCLGCAWPLEIDYISSVFTLNSDVGVPIQSLKLLNLYFHLFVFLLFALSFVFFYVCILFVHP